MEEERFAVRTMEPVYCQAQDRLRRIGFRREDHTGDAYSRGFQAGSSRRELDFQPLDDLFRISSFAVQQQDRQGLTIEASQDVGVPEIFMDATGQQFNIVRIAQAIVDVKQDMCQEGRVSLGSQELSLQEKGKRLAMKTDDIFSKLI